MRERAAPPGINEQGHGLDFATSRPPFHIFAELLGEAMGRGLFFGVLPGALAMAFGSTRYAQPGYLYLVPGGLLFMAVMSAMIRVPVTGLPLVRWRRLRVVMASLIVPVGFIWLATPVQHWAGIRPSGTAKTLTSAAFLVFAFAMTGYANRIFAVFRVSAPDGDDQAQLRWLDIRIGYFRRLLASRWLWPLNPRAVYRGLGHDLMARFQCPGGAQAADLRAAVACFRTVARQTGPSAAGEAGALHDLVYALFMLAALEMCDEEIDEAIELADAISARWSGQLRDTERDFIVMERHYLALTRYIDQGRYDPGSLGPDDLAAIQDTIDELTRMTTVPDRPAWMRAQILMFVASFYIFFGRKPDGIAGALDWLDRGLGAAVGAQSLTEDPWLAAVARAMIAQAAARRYRLRSHLPEPPAGYEDDHRKALAYIASTLDDPSLSRRRPGEPYPVGLGRLLVAVTLCLDVELARRRWSAAYQLGRHALTAVNLTITQALFRADIEDVAWAMAGLHHQLGYATAMLAAGDTDEARRRTALLSMIDLFEHSRAVLQHAELNLADFEDRARWLAGAGHGRLAARVTDLAARARAVHALQLDVHDVAGRTARSLSGPSGLPLRDEIRAQQAEFTELEKRIAELSGTADPGAALEATLTAATAGGPLCYLTHLTDGTDGRGPDLPGLAVIVSAASADAVMVTSVSLPGMTGPAVRRWLTRWPPDPAAPSGPDTAALLRELGTEVMTPVLAAAGYPDRLVLLPDGLLSVLPLHAAETTAGPVIGSHVVHYAPSARIMAACLGRAARFAEHAPGRLPPRFLGFAYPGDLPGLPYAQQEVRTAAAFFPERTFLCGHQASATAVRTALLDGDAAGSASVVHFACHAGAIPSDPLSSYLALAPSAGPDRLRLADLLALGLRQIRLAVLSACQTGQRGSRDPDQYASLTTGFLQIGAAGVIGTTTEVGDKAAQVLITRFYEQWRARPADPAGALAAAQASVAASGRPPEAWAPFFYAGA